MKIQMDRQINTYLILFALISCLFIHSSSTNFGQYSGAFVVKQIIFYCIGFVLMYAVARLDLKQLKKISWPFYAVIVLLLIVLIFAPESIARPINHAKSWYQIKLIGTFQPSEFLKFAYLLVVAKLIESHNTKGQVQTYITDLWLLTKIAIVVIPPMLIVYKQPDTGMLMLYTAMLIPMIYFSGVKKQLLAIITLIPTVILSTIVIIYFRFNSFFTEKILGGLSPHQVSRINGWLHPFEFSDSAFQTKQGLLAIGTGLLGGKGYLRNNVYVPEKHTDFIFSTIAEETGFIGGAVVIVLFFLLLHRMVFHALHAKKQFTFLIAAGIIGLLAFQIFQNIGMTIGLLPVTGVTLPFLSYGGSSLLSNLMLIGLIHAIKLSYSSYMFQNTDEKEVRFGDEFTREKNAHSI
ncbi:rod shape-determining protein RodA [Viridibacillus sp. YIM B01967]|uniref:Rod shape-determining protein RodA n=1 Tax=Viridibacillus soli TaxID=2798301 RepID=A0ABS1H1I3_9BACL|nr:FtsW/RodA/SpoVE family cell cycle protein [Viridibacillus soli]MBK3493282.1 rod shape-determining protein RodA [Viridibacillus soli]